MLGLSLCTQALAHDCVHTIDTRWKESAFYANNNINCSETLDQLGCLNFAFENLQDMDLVI